MALVIHAAIQQLVLFRVILANAAEGLYGRGVAPSRAGIGGSLVAAPFFVGMHNDPTGLRLLDLAVAGGVFGLLYVHTGELALGIGAHLGGLYGGNVISSSAASAVDCLAVFQVTGSLPGALGVVDAYGFPKVVVAYLVLLGWLKWRGGELAFRPGIARRSESGASSGAP